MIIPQIALEEYLITCGDVLIICTDGVSDWIDESEFVSALRNSYSIEDYCRNLFSMVKKRCPANRLDDMTIIAAEL